MSTKPFTFSCIFLEITINGEPSSVQILAYASADFFGRVCKIIPLTNKARNKNGTSITYLSIKNSSKYGLTSLAVGLSGEPRFTNNTPFIVL